MGGIQTVLAADLAPGYRAAVNFAGAAKSWRPYPELRTRMITAVRNAKIPILFIQAENLRPQPSRVLAEEMQRAGKVHKVKIYPAFGSTSQDGHEFCVRGVGIWGADVFSFLEANLR